MLHRKSHPRLVNLCAVARITALRSPKCGVTHVRRFFWREAENWERQHWISQHRHGEHSQGMHSLTEPGITATL